MNSATAFFSSRGFLWALLAAGVLAVLAISPRLQAAEVDSDGDGFSDVIEIAFKTNPNDPKSTPLGNQPAPAAQPINKAGAKIFLDFTNTQFDNIVAFGDIAADLPVGSDLSGLKLAISLGAVVSMFELDANGHSENPLGIIDFRVGDKGVHFILTAQAANLEKLFAKDGLTNADATLKSVSLDMTLYFAKGKFTVTMPGFYSATANKSGKAFMGAVSEDAKLKKPKTQITSFTVSPLPAVANQAVTFKGEVSIKELTGEIRAHIAFGDKSEPIRTDGATLQTMLKAGIAHTYKADGVYEARVGFGAENDVLTTRMFVVVGSNFVVNSLNGTVSRLTKGANGVVTLAHNVENVPDAMGAMTTFRDQKGNPVGLPRSEGGRALSASDPQSGLAIQRTFFLPGMYVAEIIPVDANNNAMGVVRKTITISSNDLGSSNADVAARDTSTDNAINLTSMSGKFLFTSSKQDKVIFTGTVTLPAGFSPYQTGGNDITVGMGNVVDTIHLNEKAKAVLPSTSGRVTKFSFTFPKLSTGVATGTETGKVSMTMNVADLDLLGFDSEGISVSVRADESTQSSVTRYIQVSMLVSGRSFTSLVPVSYKVNTDSEFGSISSRN